MFWLEILNVSKVWKCTVSYQIMTISRVTIGIETASREIPQKIYANFHMQSWRTLKNILFMAKIPKKLFRELGNIAENYKGAIPNMNDVLESS